MKDIDLHEGRAVWDYLLNNMAYVGSTPAINNDGLAYLSELAKKRRIGGFDCLMTDEQVEKASKEDTSLNHVRRIIKAWAIRFNESKKFVVPPTEIEDDRAAFGVSKFIFNLLGVDCDKVRIPKDAEHYLDDLTLRASIDKKYENEIDRLYAELSVVTMELKNRTNEVMKLQAYILDHIQR